MGFVTPLLLGGAALVAVPIVLHLIMRREAQQLLFPALRFVQQRRNMNQHRLRLRHLLLLALRCAVIALLAFALARPMLRATGATGKEDAPVATALVFDNSPRMQYQHENRSRLEQAQQTAAWLLDQLPAESPVTVVDRAGRLRGQDLDRAGAELRVERLDLSATVRPMEDALREAMRWVESKPEYRGEVYVFTDLSAEAWQKETTAEFAKWLDDSPGTNVYLVDVGVREPRNIGLGTLKLSSERLAPGGLLRLETEAYKEQGAGNEEREGEVVVELYLKDRSGEVEKRGQQVVSIGDGADFEPSPGTSLQGRGMAAAAQLVEFTLSGLELGVHQGFVRVLASDALAADDVRYFTVEVRPPSKILLLGETRDDTLFMREALAPSAAVGLVQPKFECDVATFSRLGDLPLAEYEAVLLMDPPPLSDASWMLLTEYAERGGGVGIFLGRHARRDEMNRAEAQRMLPARLRWQSREETYLRPMAVEHPALGELRELGDAVPWAAFPVFRYWELEAGEPPPYPLPKGEGFNAGTKQQAAVVVASYSNGKPALVERQLGSGLVLMLTTPVSDPAHRDPWNLLPTAPDPWPFLALANGIADYLSGAGDIRLNYLTGRTVVLPLSEEERVTNYVLQLPDGTAMRQPLTPGQTELSIAATEDPGNYRVRAGGQTERLDLGFSINLPAGLTRLERVSGAELLAALGDERARLVRTQEEIEVRVGLARSGRELFPFVILLVALVLAAEQWLANRFYEGGASRIASARGVDKERGRQGESGRSTNLPLSPSPPLPVSSGQL